MNQSTDNLTKNSIVSTSWALIPIFIISVPIIFVFITYLSKPELYSQTFSISIVLTLILIFFIFCVILFYISITDINNPVYLFESYQKIGIFLVVFFLVFGIIFVLHKQTGKTNNADTFLSYFIILLLLVISAVIFGPIIKKIMKTENETPLFLKKYFGALIKYGAFFVLYFLFIIGLYIFNPFNIMTLYASEPTAFIFMFIGVSLILMLAGLGWLSDPANVINQSDLNKYTGYEAMFRDIFQTKPFYIIASLGISAGFLYWILKILGFLDEDNDKNSKQYIVTTIINLLILIGMLAIIYKAAVASGLLETDNPYLSLLFNTILYIPCLLVNLLDFIVGVFRGTGTPGTPGSPRSISDSILSAFKPGFGPTTTNDLIFLGVSTSLCGIYLLMNYVIIPYSNKKYYKQGGQQLINKPISTNVLTNVTTYQSLNGSEKIDYKYAFSFWFNIDSFTSLILSGKSLDLISIL